MFQSVLVPENIALCSEVHIARIIIAMVGHHLMGPEPCKISLVKIVTLEFELLTSLPALVFCLEKVVVWL